MKAIPHFGNAPPHFRADKVLQVTLKERSTVRGAGAAVKSGIIPGKFLLWGYGHEQLYMGALYGQISLEWSLWDWELPGPLTHQK